MRNRVFPTKRLILSLQDEEQSLSTKRLILSLSKDEASKMYIV